MLDFVCLVLLFLPFELLESDGSVNTYVCYVKLSNGASRGPGPPRAVLVGGWAPGPGRFEA